MARLLCMLIVLGVAVEALHVQRPKFRGSSLNLFADTEYRTDEQLGFMARTLVKAKCEDKKMIKELGPVIGSLSEFWQKKEQRTIYPWVLTALPALRYGGVSVIDSQKKQRTFDHDVDFLIQMPNKTYEQAQEKVNQWREHLFNTTKLVSWELDGSSILGAQQKSKTFNTIGVHHFWLMVKQNSGVADAMKNSDFPEHFYNKLVPHQNAPSGFHPTKIVEDLAYNSQKHNWLNSVQTIFGSGQTMVDLWMKLEPLGDAYQPSPGKKMMFVAHEFPMMKDPEVIYRDIIDTFEQDHRIRKTEGICDLREPKGLFDEDVAPSKEMTQLVEKCTKLLDNNGYASLEYCV